MLFDQPLKEPPAADSKCPVQNHCSCSRHGPHLKPSQQSWLWTSPHRTQLSSTLPKVRGKLTVVTQDPAPLKWVVRDLQQKIVDHGTFHAVHSLWKELTTVIHSEPVANISLCSTCSLPQTRQEERVGAQTTSRARNPTSFHQPGVCILVGDPLAPAVLFFD